MRIIHLIPTLAGGGAERQLAMLAIEQVRQGHQVHIGVRQGGVHEQALRVHGVVIHQLGDHKGVNPLLVWRIWRLLRQVKPSIVQTWLMQMDLVGGLAARLAGVTWVATERSSAGAYASPVMRWRAWLRWRLLRRAHAIVANSSEGAAYWRERVGSDACIRKVGNAIDLAAMRTALASTAAPASALRSDAPPRVLVVGRLIQSKALDVVIDAVKRLPADLPIDVRIVGDGPLRAQVHAWIDAGGLASRVSLLPYSEGWWSEMAGASVLVSMSRYEGQPNVVLEAMAAGCPLIVSDIPAHREILSSDSALLVPLDRADMLVEALSTVLADPASARSRAVKASACVSQWTTGNMAQAYEDVYRQAAKKGG